MTEQQRENVLNASCVTQIQKDIVDQLGSRQPNSDHDLFLCFGAGLAFGSALEFLSPTTELVVTGCLIKSTFHHTSQSD